MYFLFLPGSMECKNNVYVHPKKCVWGEIQSNQSYEIMRNGNINYTYLQQKNASCFMCIISVWIDACKLVPIWILIVFCLFLLYNNIVLNKYIIFKTLGKLSFLALWELCQEKVDTRANIGFDGNIRAKSGSELNYISDGSRLVTILGITLYTKRKSRRTCKCTLFCRSRF